MTEQAQDKKRPLPCITNYAKAYKDYPERKATVSLALLHTKEGNKPFLEGYVRVPNENGETTTVGVIGNFVALNKNYDAATQKDNAPVVFFTAKNPEHAALIENAAMWPFNETKAGDERFDTVSIKIGDTAHYAHVFTRDLPADVIDMIGVRVREQVQEETQEQTQEESIKPSM